jgi:hypothetical protein
MISRSAFAFVRAPDLSRAFPTNRKYKLMTYEEMIAQLRVTGHDVSGFATKAVGPGPGVDPRDARLIKDLSSGFAPVIAKQIDQRVAPLLARIANLEARVAELSSLKSARSGMPLTAAHRPPAAAARDRPGFVPAAVPRSSPVAAAEQSVPTTSEDSPEVFIRFGEREFDRQVDQVLRQFEDGARSRGCGEGEIERAVFSAMQTVMECRHQFFAALPQIVADALANDVRGA